MTCVIHDMDTHVYTQTYRGQLQEAPQQRVTHRVSDTTQISGDQLRNIWEQENWWGHRWTVISVELWTSLFQAGVPCLRFMEIQKSDPFSAGDVPTLQPVCSVLKLRRFTQNSGSFWRLPVGSLGSHAGKAKLQILLSWSGGRPTGISVAPRGIPPGKVFLKMAGGSPKLWLV